MPDFSFKPMSAEELNQLQRFTCEPFPVRRKAPGQIWTIRPDISDWLPDSVEMPPLFPVIITHADKTVQRTILGENISIPACSVTPLHHLRENAASDDLFCTDKDGIFAPYMIATWIELVVFEKHLDKCIGVLSEETINRMNALMIPGHGEVSREFTGTAIINRTDFRLKYREYFLKQADLISLPYDKFEYAFESIEKIKSGLIEKEYEKGIVNHIKAFAVTGDPDSLNAVFSEEEKFVDYPDENIIPFPREKVTDGIKAIAVREHDQNKYYTNIVPLNIKTTPDGIIQEAAEDYSYLPWEEEFQPTGTLGKGDETNKEAVCFKRNFDSLVLGITVIRIDDPRHVDISINLQDMYAKEKPYIGYNVSLYKDSKTQKGKKPVRISNYIPDDTIFRRVELGEYLLQIEDPKRKNKAIISIQLRLHS